MKYMNQNIKLILALILGSFLGYCLGPKSINLKPLGDLFLGLLLTAVVPYVFFSITSAVAHIPSHKRLGKIMFCTLLIFILTGILASLFMILAVTLFPLHVNLPTNVHSLSLPEHSSWGDFFVKTFTTHDFMDLFSKNNLLPLIVFSILLGRSIALSQESGQHFLKFVKSGTHIMSKYIEILMLFAPIGLFCYFAYLVGVFGPTLMGTYGQAMFIYYIVAILYFIFGLSLYVSWAVGPKFIFQFWRNVLPTALTALATGSSVASLSLNLNAAKKNGVHEDVAQLVLPLGATIHMDGSCLSAILKIALLLGIFGSGFHGVHTILVAIFVALISSTVMAGIPGGGFIGEILILNFYHFPPEAYAILLTIGTLVDPMATAINCIGDNVAALMVTKVLKIK